jgi:hypothetical protein
MKILDGASDFEDGDALQRQHRKEVDGGSAQKPGKGNKRQSVYSALSELVDLSSPSKAVEQSDLTFAQTDKTDKIIRLQADHPGMFGPEERLAAQNLRRQAGRSRSWSDRGDTARRRRRRWWKRVSRKARPGRRPRRG